MKRTLIGALAIALALVGAGCNSSQNNNIEVTKPFVTAHATNAGGTLHLTWNEETGAKFEIKAGSAVDTTDTGVTSYDVTTPVETVAVVAFSSANRSDAAIVICSKLVSSSVTFYNDLDTTHENGFGFDTTGAATAYKYAVENFPMLDFIATTSGGQTMLQKAGGTATRAGDKLKAATGTYDAITIADSMGTYLNTVALYADSAYYLRMSANDTMWTAADNYAKMHVDSISGTKVSVTVTYQTVNGIRWLK
ncbi:MAG TPA: hypothetical protein VMH22_14715 [bacterium]|nr:hypothetical protein [bacterium]